MARKRKRTGKSARSSESGKAKHTPKRRESKQGLETPPVICFFSSSCCTGMRYLHCLQSVKARDAEKGSSSGKRKSIKESIFAVEHAEVLKPIYKYYQAMMFATHGHNFMWDAVRRKACVQNRTSDAPRRRKGVSLPRNLHPFQESSGGRTSWQGRRAKVPALAHDVWLIPVKTLCCGMAARTSSCSLSPSITV